MPLYQRGRRDPTLEDELRTTTCVGCDRAVADGAVIYTRSPKLMAFHAGCAGDWVVPLLGDVHEYKLNTSKMSARYGWVSRKILGGLAENICRQHFEAMDYTVQSFGIEHTAEALINTKDFLGKRGVIPKPFGDILRDLPDFLISRLCPNTWRARNMGVAGAAQTVFIQVKYASRLKAESYFKWLKSKYSKLLAILPTNMLFYVVAKEATLRGAPIDSHVFVYNPETDEWRACGIDPFADNAFFFTATTSLHINAVYGAAIVPALKTLWGTVRTAEPLPPALRYYDAGYTPEPLHFRLGSCRDDGTSLMVVDSCLVIRSSEDADVIERLFDMEDTQGRAVSFDSAEETVCDAIAVARTAPPPQPMRLLLRVLKCIEESRSSPYGEFAIEREWPSG